MEQNRRSSRTATADIMFAASMHTTTTQAEFLGNGTNNSRLITAISSILDQAGITVGQATSDTDTMMIASTALELADSGEVVVLVGTDTYLLVMLVVRAPYDAKLFMLLPSMNNKPAKVFNISTLYRQGNKGEFRLLMSNDDLPGYEVKMFNSET